MRKNKHAMVNIYFASGGMVLSLAMMIMGISRWIDFRSVSTANVELKFGADFYTEMYEITRWTQNTVSAVGRHTVEAVNLGMGAILTFAAAFLFLYNLRMLILNIIDLYSVEESTSPKNSAESAEDSVIAENAKKVAIVSEAQSLMNGSDIAQYRKAEELLMTVPGFADADEMLSICRTKIQQIIAEKQTAFAQAESLFETAVSIDDYEKILISVEGLEDVCDTSALKEACSNRIAEIKSRLEEENRREKKARHRKIAKKALLAFLIIAVVAAVCWFVSTKFVVPYIKYQMATDNIENGDYTKAYDTLMSLGDYKDSIDKAASIRSKAEGERIKVAKIGDFVRFGKYEQDNDMSNGKELIEWEVLDINDSKALIIARYGIVKKPFHDEKESTVWSKCTLRKWLNDDFITEAFAENEFAAICETDVSADNNPEHPYVSAGPATTDKIFILSYSEAEKYFETEESRMCIPTEYAVEQGTHVYKNGCCWWPLRTPGRSRYFISCVFSDGELEASGFNTYTYNCAVRPVMWVDTDLLEY